MQSCECASNIQGASNMLKCVLLLSIYESLASWKDFIKYWLGWYQFERFTQNMQSEHS